ncbi:hypothetical protein BTO30_13945 [Domibacillus antri]|uniref:histidine kinase n=1 Tax=Domibacillus antri TaxID=1714264 RepID=A0A1Q8Q2Q4_9BACI|nr:ATP-binding protein [Domibacillus antri]OLN21582.1 hypothetical protein BTO30_13945 [Domibacillus antri]
MDKLLKMKHQLREESLTSRFIHITDGQFESFFGHFAEGFLFVDDEWQLTYVNRQLELLLGREHGELIDQNVWNVFPEWTGTLIEHRLREAAETRENVTFEVFSKTHRRCCEMTISPQVTGMAVFLKDVHDRYETMAKLMDTEQRLQEITENIREIFCIYTVPDRQILYVSEAFERIWGSKRDAIYENPALIVKMVHPIDEHLFLKETNGRSGTFEYRIVRPDCSIRWIRSNKTVIYNENNEPVRVLSVSEDITELKEKEQLIQNADTLGAIGQLAAGIAHEIRNPMTAIKGFVQLWQQESVNPFSEIILSELARVEFIMNEFLMLAKPHHSHKMERIELKALIDEVVTFMSAEALLKNIDIKVDLQEQLPFLNLETKQIKQVLINLIKNGMEAMDEGGFIKVSAAKYPGAVSIDIIDQGIGISPEAIPHLGEPFFSNKENGTGLGLMVSMKIIDHHNGDLSFTSEEGQGTKATITLPVNS